MDAKTYFQHQMNMVRLMYHSIVQDMNDEQFNWTPSGTCNAIRVTLVHMLTSEDWQIHMIQGKPTVWEADGWGKKLGLSNPPSKEHGWDELKATSLPFAEVLAYGEAVFNATEAYVSNLTAETFSQPYNLFGQERTLADALSLLVVHVTGHAGEIAAVKGMQGLKGQAF